ncbi:MAG: DUF429 domain-containing protein [Chloroflexi bacterium]|nr:DUF429 domain-containing protein [Chloroflexota bacterium]
MDVAGVDGCKGGWLLVRADATGQLRIEDVSIISTFRELIAATAECAAIAVDIPIGLPTNEPRAADGEARKAIGPRRSSVFPAPMRAVLAASTYDQACVLSLAACGKKLSKQAFAILPKIREADEAMTPAVQERVREVHPEVSFWALNDHQPLEHAKLKPDGAAERLRLLTPAYRDDLASVNLARGAKRDDLYDACAAAWTAGRIAYGTARRLPAEPPLDSHGLRMEIVY